MTRWVAGALVAAAMTAAIGFGSRVPYSPGDSDASILRLSWRLRGEKVETCRDRTPAELEALPVHMRTPQVCTGHLVSYLLTLRVDGEVVDTTTFLPAGAKGDRPIFVLHDEPLVPGRRKVRVDFVPVGGDVDNDDDDDDDHDNNDDDDRKALRFSGRVNAVPGRIQMITLGSNGDGLVLVK